MTQDLVDNLIHQNQQMQAEVLKLTEEINNLKLKSRNQ